MTGTKKKQKPIAKNTESLLKKRSKSLTTSSESKTSTPTTAKETKTGGKSSGKRKKEKPTLSSTWTLQGGELGSSAQDALQSVKQRSMANRASGGDGWVSAISSENAGFHELADNLRKSRGRPRRDPAGAAKVEGLRLSEAELEIIEQRARKARFKSWRVWARLCLLERWKKL